MLRNIIKTLDGYDLLKREFDALAIAYSSDVTDFEASDFEISLYYRRLIPLLEKATAANAYRLLAYLYAINTKHHPKKNSSNPPAEGKNQPVESKEETAAKLKAYKAAYKLLDTCPIQLDPIIKMITLPENKEGHEDVVEGVQDDIEADLLCEQNYAVDLPDHKFRKPNRTNLTHERLSEPETATDTFYEILVKRLHLANVHLDDNGTFYKFEGERQAVGSPSNVLRDDSGFKVISLTNPHGFNEVLIYDYTATVRQYYQSYECLAQLDINFFKPNAVEILAQIQQMWIFEDLGVRTLNLMGAQKLIEIFSNDAESRKILLQSDSVESGVRALEEKFVSTLVDKKHYKKYSALLNRLAPQYVSAHFKELNRILEANTLLLAAIEDGYIHDVFYQIPITDKKLMITPAAINACMAEVKRNNNYPTAQLISTMWSLITTPELNFDMKFILSFNQEYLRTNKALFLAYCDSCQNAHGSQLAWLDSLSFDSANRILKILSTISFRVDYRLLFNGSDKLRHTDTLKEYAFKEMLISPDEEFQEAKFDAEELPAVGSEDFASESAAIKNGTLTFDAIRANALQELSKYAAENLVKKDGLYYGKGLVPNERGMAYKELIDVIDTQEPDWSKFENLLLSNQFKLSAGYIVNPDMMQKISARYGFWELVSDIREKVIAQKALFKKFVNNELLVKVISDDELYNALTTDEMEYIFDHCNRELYLELLIKYNRLENFAPFKTRNTRPRLVLHAELIKLMMTEEVGMLDKANALRKQFHMAQRLPDNFQKPGLSENIDELSPELLYQFEGADIATGEAILIEKYKELFINHIMTPEVRYLSPLEMKNEVSANIKFFYAPISLHPMLIDPSKTGCDVVLMYMPPDVEYTPGDIPINSPAAYVRYNDQLFYVNKSSKPHPECRELIDIDLAYFDSVAQATNDARGLTEAELIRIEEITGHKHKITSHSYLQFAAFSKQLRNLVDNFEPERFNKPIVICGILNLDGVHYIPYFLHKNITNQIHIITVDPSPQTKDWSNDLPERERCLKQNSHEKLKKIFQSIFPGCNYSDPNITQQLRQRDCGPNALTVLEDAFKHAITEMPLITVLDGNLNIRPERLSVNFNNMRLYNFVSSKYYYSPLTARVGNQNRAKWAQRLQKFNLTSNLIMNGNGDPILRSGTEFIFINLEEYDYNKNVLSQSRSDQTDVLHSEVAVAIISEGGFEDDIDAIKNQFITSLRLPGKETIRMYADKIRAKYPAIMASIEEKNADLDTLILRNIEVNIDDCYEEAVINAWNKYVNNYKVRELNETYMGMINAFVESSNAAKYFKKLTPAKQAKLKAEIFTPAAHLAFAGKLTKYHTSVVKTYLSRELDRILTKDLCVSTGDSLEKVTLALLNYLKQLQVLEISINYLEKYNSSDLNTYLSESLTIVATPYAEATFTFLKNVIDKYESIHDLTTFEPQFRVTFLSPHVRACLPENASGGVIGRNQLKVDVYQNEYSPLACLIGTKINQNLMEIFVQRFNLLLLKHMRQSFNLSEKVQKFTLTDYCNLINNEESLQELLAELLLPFVPNPTLLVELKKLVTSQVKQRAITVANIILDKYSLVSIDLDKLLNDKSKDAPEILLSTIVAELLMQNSLRENGEKILTEIENEMIKAFFAPTITPTQSVSLATVAAETPVTGRIFNELYARPIFGVIEQKYLIVVEFRNRLEIYNAFVEQISAQLDFLQVRSCIQTNPTVKWLLEKLSRSIPCFLVLSQQFACKAIQPEQMKQEISNATSSLQADMKVFLEVLKQCYYKNGDVDFNGFTCILRQLLCQALNIQLASMQAKARKVFPTYLNRAIALQVDKIIDEKITNFVWETLSESQFTLNLPVNMLVTKAVPDTAEQILTARVLYQIAFNWQANYKSEEEYHFLLNKLLGVLMQIPAELPQDKALPQAWCEQHLKPLLNDLGNLNNPENKIPCLFLEAIGNFPIFLSTTAQQASENDEIIKCSHLKEILALYKNERKANVIKRYFERVQAPASLTCTAAAVENKLKSPGSFGIRLFSQVSGLEKFEAALNRIIRRHKLVMANADFALDKGDMTILQDLLAQRWAELQADPRKLNNYKHFHDALDRIYLLIALVLKQVAINIGQEISAYQFLMPGMIKQGRLDRNNEEEKGAEIILEKDIDDYNYSDILTLKDGRWLPQSQIIYQYQRSKLLKDPFTQIELSVDVVEHILNTYPLAAEKLCDEFVGHFCDILDHPEIQRQLLLFINASFHVSGFISSYSSEDDKKAVAAYNRLMDYIAKLSDQVRKLLMLIPVPGSGSNQKLSDLLLGKVKLGCVTAVCYDIAKVLWVNCPNIQFEEFGPQFALMEDSRKRWVTDLPRKPHNSPELANNQAIQANQIPLRDLIFRRSMNIEINVAAMRP